MKDGLEEQKLQTALKDKVKSCCFPPRTWQPYDSPYARQKSGSADD